MLQRNRIASIVLGVMPVSLIAPNACAQTVATNPYLLWYDKPAEKWEQALAIGNGRLGATIYGQPRKERLQLNEITVWGGGPQPDADRQDAYKDLPELRRLIREGRYAEAERFANANFNGPAPYKASYQMLGDLNFEFQLPAGAVADTGAGSISIPR